MEEDFPALSDASLSFLSAEVSFLLELLDGVEECLAVALKVVYYLRINLHIVIYLPVGCLDLAFSFLSMSDVADRLLLEVEDEGHSSIQGNLVPGISGNSLSEEELIFSANDLKVFRSLECGLYVKFSNHSLTHLHTKLYVYQ